MNHTPTGPRHRGAGAITAYWQRNGVIYHEQSRGEDVWYAAAGGRRSPCFPTRAAADTWLRHQQAQDPGGTPPCPPP